VSEDQFREVARELLRELLPETLDEASGNGHANGHAPAPPVPRVPAPPVAAVLRPSTWKRPPAPGEVIGDAEPAGAAVQPTPAGINRPSVAPPPAPSAPPAPSTPPAPSAPPAPPAALTSGPGDERVEAVAINSDEDLMAFVRRLMGRLEHPRERLALRTGRLRFTLGRSHLPAGPGAGSPAAPATRVEKGAVTERVIRAAAQAGTRLVLAPGAVLTPLAREQARALGVEIERERRC